MTSILPPTRDLAHCLHRASAVREVLTIAMATISLNLDLVEEIAQTATQDTLLPDICQSVLGFREALEAINWPSEESDS